MSVPVTVFIFVATCVVLNVTLVESQEDNLVSDCGRLSSESGGMNPGWHSKYPGTKKRFYIGSSKKMNWYAAYFHCMQNDSLLASAESIEDHQELANLIDNSATPLEHFWLGGNDLPKEGHWVWSMGQDHSFTNWLPNEPRNTRTENCLEMRDKEENHGWNDRIWSLELYFICEYRTAIRSDWPPAGAGEKKFYLDLGMKADWHSAYMHCLRNNSRLARIENKEENDIVVAMIKEANLGFDLEYWLGAMDFPEVGLYFWLATGLPVRGYSNWHAGQGMGEDQRCLTYWQSSKHVVRWNDFICTTLYPFVCEYYE